MSYRLSLILFSLWLTSCISQTKEQMPKHVYTNSLINETSPYLLQHAHNPVEWHPWNDETLAKAKREQKLILISVGYSACHWCHVMEEESFEDVEVAKLMNENFINIKVDREERPDVDQVYMNAVQLITGGQGGWPLNSIALPDARPFWGTTYLPKENWMSALSQIVKVYKDSPEKLIDAADKLTEGIQTSGIIALNTEPSEFTINEADEIVDQWKKYMDFNMGGPNRAPKFPMPNNYQFLLRYAVQRDNSQILDYVNTTLHKMALGGLYDQVGGGFARYSVDDKWHIPHFEKMLYDNAQLVSLYADAYLVSKKPLYKKIVLETLTFVERELMHENGAFYASLDADSMNENEELEEGTFYVWTKADLQDLLKEDFDLFSAYYNITDAYVWEQNSYHLYRTETNSVFAKKHKIEEQALTEKINSWKKLLLKERAKKARPRLDDKLLSGWNGLMLKGYADAYRVFGDQHYLDKANDIGDFLNSQIRKDGGLFRNYKNGKSAINAYLEDYAAVIDGFINLYQVSFDQKWLDRAMKLSEYCHEHFLDKESGFFFFTSNLDPALIARKIEIDDNVIPSSNSIMALNIFRLGHYFGKPAYIKEARNMLHHIKDRMIRYGAGASNWGQLYLNMLGNYYEIAIVGKDANKKRRELQAHFLPNALFVGSTKESELPLLQYKYNDEDTTFFVCIEGTCKLPVTNTKKALEQISIDLN